MTLLFFDGCDNALTMPKPQMVYGGNSASMQLGRDGSTNGCWGTAGTSGNAVINYVPDAPIATMIIGYGYRCDSASFVGRINFFTGGTGTVQSGLYHNNSTGQWQFYTGDKVNLQASSSPADVYTHHAWVHVQIKVVLHATAGTFILRVNGVELINWTGPTALTSGTITGVTWRTNSSGGSERLYIDDLWVCDSVNAAATQGRPYNDFLGDLKVVTLVPTGAGDTTQWTPSFGANWDTLDENPPDTVAYVSTSSANSGFRDLYACTDLPAEAISVLALQAKSYALSTDVGLARYKPIVKEHGVVSPLGNHATNISVTPYTGPMTTVRPSDGALIGVADVNAMQIGVEVV
jgi:hypothetical protein